MEGPHVLPQGPQLERGGQAPLNEHHALSLLYRNSAEDARQPVRANDLGDSLGRLATSNSSPSLKATWQSSLLYADNSIKGSVSTHLPTQGVPPPSTPSTKSRRASLHIEVPSQYPGDSHPSPAPFASPQGSRARRSSVDAAVLYSMSLGSSRLHLGNETALDVPRTPLSTDVLATRPSSRFGSVARMAQPLAGKQATPLPVAHSPTVRRHSHMLLGTEWLSSEEGLTPSSRHNQHRGMGSEGTALMNEVTQLELLYGLNGDGRPLALQSINRLSHETSRRSSVEINPLMSKTSVELARPASRCSHDLQTGMSVPHSASFTALSGSHTSPGASSDAAQHAAHPPSTPSGTHFNRRFSMHTTSNGAEPGTGSPQQTQQSPVAHTTAAADSLLGKLRGALEMDD